MKGLIMLTALALCTVAAGQPNAVGLTLASRGKTPYAIVVGDKASAVEMTAAAQLQKYLTASTGADFKIVKESWYDSGKPAILVGSTKRTLEYMPGFNWASLGREGIVIKTIGNDLILAGGQPRGTIYSVMTFLEEQVGVRWWTALEEDVPMHRNLNIKNLNITFVPKLPIRHNWTLELQGMQPYVGPNVTDEKSNLFCIHLRNNGKESIPDEMGGTNTIYGVHTVPLQYLPADKYFAAHPEWYGLVNGSRLAHQVCWTNKEMRKQLISNVLTFLREHPKVTVVSVSQNDGGNPCECPECMAIVNREGTQMGPILDGVNEVADAVGKEFPNVMVESLSYYYSRKCPKFMKARDNVLIRICTYEQTINKPLIENDYNKDNRSNVLEWGNHAKNLFVWNYVTDFAHYMYPQPNVFNLAPNLRFFIEHNVKGTFMQGDIHCQTGDLQNLRAWLVSHLLWNPYQDDKKLVREFCNGYYGPAGKYVYEYVTTMCKAGYDSPKFIGIYNGDLSFLTLDVTNKSIGLWDKAETAVKNDPVKSQRVKKARLSFDLACIVNRQRLLDEAKAAGKTYLGPSDETKAVIDLLDSVKAFGSTHMSEVGGEIWLFDSTLRNRFVPPTESELEKADRIEIQSSDFGVEVNPRVKYVDDPAARYGKAIMTTGDHNEWYINCPVKSRLFGKWHCKSYVRVDATNTTGTAMQMGIYDPVMSCEIMLTTSIPTAKCAGKDYVEIDMGTYELRPKMGIWFAPVNTPKDVQAIYVDRIVLERVK